jgi:hypothetical protein
MAQPVLEAAEQAAKASTGSDKYKRAAYVSLAVYRAQLIYLKSVCIASRQQTYSPDELIEISYAAVIAPDRNTALRLLPESFALNLTPRVAVVGLALACSKSTPALGVLLATFAIPCGTTSGMGANNSFKPNLLRSSKSVAEEACHAFASTTQVGLIQVLGGGA